MLYLISLPIGNSKDVTWRAVETLEKVEVLLCEDTRVTKRLLDVLKIKNRPKLISFYDQVEREKTGQILTFLEEGKEVGLVSDAGTPLLSDPGWYLIRECLKKNFEFKVIPGVSALTTAVCLSGLPMDKFSFLGFLPKKGGKRRKIFEIYKQTGDSRIIYESARRVEKTLKDILESWGNKPIVICREMTKEHEETIRGTTKEILEKIKAKKLRGEIVLVVG